MFSGIGPGLTPAEFKEEVFARVALHREAGGDFIVLICKTKVGTIPVGLVETSIIAASDIRPQGVAHLLWFPEASPRNKLEAWVRFLEQFRKGFNILFVEQETNWRFFNEVCKYGVIRPVGKLEVYFADGSDAMLYQGT